MGTLLRDILCFTQCTGTDRKYNGITHKLFINLPPRQATVPRPEISTALSNEPQANNAKFSVTAIMKTHYSV
jgi:hypothetical protein